MKYIKTVLKFIFLMALMIESIGFVVEMLTIALLLQTDIPKIIVGFIAAAMFGVHGLMFLTNGFAYIAEKFQLFSF